MKIFVLIIFFHGAGDGGRAIDRIPFLKAEECQAAAEKIAALSMNIPPKVVCVEQSNL